MVRSLVLGAAPAIALALLGSAPALAGMSFSPTPIPGWQMNHTGSTYFYLCNASSCTRGSSVTVTIHKAAPQPLAASQSAIRQDVLSANKGAVKDVIFSAPKTSTDQGLMAGYQDYQLSVVPGGNVVDPPFNRYGYISDPTVPLTVSIVSSSFDKAAAGRNFGVFANEALAPFTLKKQR